MAPESAKTINNPYEGNTIAAQRSTAVFKVVLDKNGKQGLGDGPAEKSLKPKPKSLASIMPKPNGGIVLEIVQWKGYDGAL